MDDVFAFKTNFKLNEMLAFDVTRLPVSARLNQRWVENVCLFNALDGIRLIVCEENHRYLSCSNAVIHGRCAVDASGRRIFCVCVWNTPMARLYANTIERTRWVYLYKKITNR